MKKVLVLEDEANIRSFVVINLKRAGYEAIEAETGEEALAQLKRNPDIKVALLDIMLPDMDGFEVCRRIRAGDNNIGIIMLTARTQEMDKVTGLMTGADDYVTKPFSLAVLRARVNNLLRRAHSRRTVLELPPFTFDFQEMTYTRNGVPLELSRTEQRLLRLLAEHRGQTLPRARLLEQVWDGGEFVDENALSVAVNRLRAKLTDAPIRTVYGVGYVWAVEP